MCSPIIWARRVLSSIPHGTLRFGRGMPRARCSATVRRIRILIWMELRSCSTCGFRGSGMIRIRA
ncbi:hypothetical protein [Lysobacter gummosus]|uniref:hypothetical protein n=1 Tax=Lysobacter gummosus TaxID=262324 RepID=UPI003640B0FF